MDQVSIRRALLSVSDKTGLVALAAALQRMGIEIISTGGTARALADAGLRPRDIVDVTGFPEMMDGRVKTLHPAVHGAILARRGQPEHTRALDAHGIAPIDLVVVNLYPFEAKLVAGADTSEMIENIDIGGPAMIRSAAKNHESVAVLTDPSDYGAFLEEIGASGGTTSLAFRQRLAAKAYARTAAYDAAVANWFARELNLDAPETRVIAGRLVQSLRYGENPHQTAAFYRTADARPGLATARQIQGKELSYNNINDTDAAFELISEFPEAAGPAVAIVKHANPCGVARAPTLARAYRDAFDCDRVSAFGGIIALNSEIDRETAEAISAIFTEVIIAPSASEDAIAVFSAKKNLRLLLTGELADPAGAGLSFRSVSGGFLLQSRDAVTLDAASLKVVTRRAPSEAEMRGLRFAFTVAKHVKSNAIVYAKGERTVGIGAGQMNRLDSSRIAAMKAAEAAQALGLGESLAQGSVVASDAFFPFADGLLAAAKAGATAVVQPGGSVRDHEVIAAADDAGLAMVFTGVRHFRH